MATPVTGTFIYTATAKPRIKNVALVFLIIIFINIAKPNAGNKPVAIPKPLMTKSGITSSKPLIASLPNR